MSSSSKPASRFASFKVFKFPKADPSVPPPPPPKDPVYLSNKYLYTNRSLASLSPDSLSVPSTPLSPHFLYGRQPADATHSAVSLVSSGDGTNQPGELKRKKSGKARSVFNLGRRKGPASINSSVDSEDLPPAPQEDENISMPWNFQHHIHVDEGYVGLPPSWSSSLKEVGFTESEIHAIQTRRTPLPSDRRPSTGDPAHPPTLLSRPTRTTSLRGRQFSSSNPSLLTQGTTVPPVPTVRSSPTPSATSRRTPPRQQSEPTHSHQYHASNASSFSIDQYQQVNPGSFSSEEQYVYVETERGPSSVTHSHERGPSTAPSRTTSRPTSRSASRAASSRSASIQSNRSGASGRGRVRDTIMPVPRPQTPPRMTAPKGFHVVNGSPPSGPQSPPPAYSVGEGGSTNDSGWPKAKQPFHAGSLSSLSSRGHKAGKRRERTDSDDSYSVESGNSVVESVGDHIDGAKTSPIPPRISFHQGAGDLDGWAESLISAIPGGDDTMGKRHHREASSSSSRKHQRVPSSSRKHRAQPSTSSATRGLERQNSQRKHGKQPSVSRYQLQKPASVVLTVPSRDEDAPQQVTPLWNELMGIVQAPVEPVRSPKEPGELTPALSESHSPILPSLRSSTGTVMSGELDVDRNRDSGMSVSTVTEAVVVSGVRAYGTRAVLERSPTSGGRMLPPSERKSWSGNTLQPGGPHTRNDSRSNFRNSQTVDQDELLDAGPQSPRFEMPTSPMTPTSNGLQMSATEVLLSSGDYDEDGEISKGPSIVLHSEDSVAVPPATPSTPLTPARTYPGWVRGVVAPLEAFIDKRVDPRDHYVELTEIAEGESGSVYAARVVGADTLKLPPPLSSPPPTTFTEGVVAIKNVPILPSGSSKLLDLHKELTLMKYVRHTNLLEMEKLYVDLSEDSLWIRMELMERSLADVVQLVPEGLMVQERMIARFANDALLGLQYLQTQQIAHRDMRSDNMLLNRDGILKIADFSNAVKVSPETPLCSEQAGVIYWQAPEMRTGPYNPLKVDVWSIGATVWEMAQSVPPFSDIEHPGQIGDKWPPLSQPELYSRSFHDFLRSCSQPASIRPDPTELLNVAFTQNACGRQVIIQLLSQCRAIEERMIEWDAGGGTQGQT